MYNEPTCPGEGRLDTFPGPKVRDMSQAEYDIAEFLVQNKEELNDFLKEVMQPFVIASRIFDNSPDLQTEFLNKKKLSYIIDFVVQNYTPANYETISLSINEETVKIYL